MGKHVTETQGSLFDLPQRLKPARPIHYCHWPGCLVAVPPKMWGCRPHWYRLPKPLRDRIWATYRPGQEITKDPSDEYIAAARAVQDWIREHQGATS